MAKPTKPPSTVLVLKPGNQKYIAPLGSLTEEYYGDGLAAPAGKTTKGNDLIDASQQAIGVRMAGDFQSVSGVNTVSIGHDNLKGGSGSDVIVGDAFSVFSGAQVWGNDSMAGGAGDDVLFGAASAVSGVGVSIHGNDTLLGGDGYDLLVGQVNEIASGSDGVTLEGNVRLDGGAGDDVIVGSANYADGVSHLTVHASNYLLGGDGNDRVFGAGRLAYGTGFEIAGNSSLYGGAGDDQLSSGFFSGVLYGSSDAQSSLQGNDLLDGGDGNDELLGDGALMKGDYIDVRGHDTLSGGAGDDLLVGDLGRFESFNAQSVSIAGDDSLSGGAGADTLAGDMKFLDGSLDTVVGAAYHVTGNDTLDGGDGPDLLVGDVSEVSANGAVVTGNDVLLGGLGDDTLIGDADTIWGDNTTVQGNDSLEGGAGNDQLYGDVRSVVGSGNTVGGDDTLKGGAGDDFLSGGAGADAYVFNFSADLSSLDGHDTIDLFEEGRDSLVFQFGDLPGTGPAVLHTIQELESFMYDDITATFVVEPVAGDTNGYRIYLASDLNPLDPSWSITILDHAVSPAG